MLTTRRRRALTLRRLTTGPVDEGCIGHIAIGRRKFQVVDYLRQGKSPSKKGETERGYEQHRDCVRVAVGDAHRTGTARRCARLGPRLVFPELQTRIIQRAITSQPSAAFQPPLHVAKRAVGVH